MVTTRPRMNDRHQVVALSVEEYVDCWGLVESGDGYNMFDVVVM